MFYFSFCDNKIWDYINKIWDYINKIFIYFLRSTFKYILSSFLSVIVGQSFYSHGSNLYRFIFIYFLCFPETRRLSVKSLFLFSLSFILISEGLIHILLSFIVFHISIGFSLVRLNISWPYRRARSLLFLLQTTSIF